ncbi:MAG TPA: primary-amine oxidase [Thermomicrobiales bacterium]|nr:primary-amine oxidase [Thermomicrobiales bacterium]
MVQMQTRNALAPLSAVEISEAAGILRMDVRMPARRRFVQITLREPNKADVLAGRDDIEREALVALMDLDARLTIEAVVSLTSGVVTAWDVISDGQPPITYDEMLGVHQACLESEEYVAAIRKRGDFDLDLLMIDPWSAGSYGEPDHRRLARCLTWVRTSEDDNGYARPVENVIALVDLHEMKVVDVEDHGLAPVPTMAGNYAPKYIGPLLDDLKPLEIQQPDGASFTVDGHEIAWQKWRLRVGFTPREGLVLHTVGWEEDGRVRPVLYRGSCAEMVVPYGDPAPTHMRKNAFDVGEYNIGLLANSLELGCDCLGLIHYFDAVFADGAGNPYTIPNAICLHEEDYGTLWRHFDFRTGSSEVRRARRLVVSFFSTVGNYDYGFFWYLYQDGSIELECKLTGIVSTGALEPGTTSKYGELLNDDGLYAPIHQHFFSFRLDMDVDGPDNAIYEVHAEAEPAGVGNALGNAFFSKATHLTTEAEAQQQIDPLRGRVWKIVNPAVRNAVGNPVGYRLVPHANVAAFAAPEASVSQRAGFIHKHLWVTPHEPGEMYAAGDYPNQHPGGAGLPAWTAGNRDISHGDLVLWYTLGSHHVVRPEDWPVMPVTRAGFTLQPIGFFDRNPALDVAKPQHVHGNGAHCGGG